MKCMAKISSDRGAETSPIFKSRFLIEDHKMLIFALKLPIWVIQVTNFIYFIIFLNELYGRNLFLAN